MGARHIKLYMYYSVISTEIVDTDILNVATFPSRSLKDVLLFAPCAWLIGVHGTSSVLSL